MKNFKNFAISRTGIISVCSLGVVLFLISTVETGTKKAPFQVVRSEVSLSGIYDKEKWGLLSSDVNSTGDFEFKDDELLDISNLSFRIPVKQLKSTNHEQEAILQNLFRQNNCTELTFRQAHTMILPIMKRAHVIGMFSMVNGGHNLPLQLHYELNGNRSLKIWGKEVIALSEFGIVIPDSEKGKIDDEIELAIDFTLINKPEDFARLFAKN